MNNNDDTPNSGSGNPMFQPSGDTGKDLMYLLSQELIRRLRENGSAMTASELEVVRKLMTDNSITLQSVKRGDLGKVAQEVAESFPFTADGAMQ